MASPHSQEDELVLQFNTARIFLAEEEEEEEEEARVVVSLLDITERKRAEEALKLFRTLIDRSDDTIEVVDPESGRFLDVNEKACIDSGYSRQELLALRVFDIDPMVDQSEFTRSVEKLRKSGVLLWEGVHRRKDGSAFPVEVNMKYVQLDRDYIVTVVRDITERKRAEEALRESELRFRSVWEKSTDGMRITNEEGIAAFVNDAYCKMVEKPRAEIEGKPMSVVYEEAKQAEVLRKHQERFRSRTIPAYLERELVLWNGKRIFLELSNTFLEIPHQQTLSLSVFRDITERKRAEETLRESEQRYRSLFENMLEGYAYCKIILDHDKPHDFIYLDVNNAFEKLTGLKNVAGKKVSEVIPGIQESNPELFDIYGRVALTGKPERFETYVAALGIWFSIAVYSPGKEYFIAVFDNITERKKAEKQIGMLAQALRSIGECVSITDMEDKLLFVNEAFLKTYGYDEHELLGKHIGVVRSPNNLPEVVREILPSTLRGGWHGELLNRRKDGSEFPIFLSTSVIRDDKGQPVALIGVAADITERKRADEEIERQHAYFQQLFENSSVAIALLDTNDTILDMNKAFEETFQYAKKEVFGRKINEVIVPESRQDEAGEFSNMAQRGQKIQKETMRKRKDGTLVNVVIYGFPIIINNELVGIYGMYVDITERKRADEELKRQTSYFLQLFDQSPNAIVLLDTSDHIVDINKAFAKLFQYTLTEIKGCSLNDFIVPDEHQAEALELSKQSLSGDMVQREVIRKRKDGTLINLSLTAYPIEIGKKKVGVYGIYEDISEEKKLQEQLRQAQKLESIGTLAGGVAHDFNNILGIILGYVGVMQLKEQSARQISEISDQIKRAVERGAALVKQLLTFARQTETKVEPVDVNSVVLELSKMLNATFPKTVEITVAGKGEIPLVKADASQLHQALLNLCVNARDAMPSGGTLSISVEQADGPSVREKFSEASAEKYIKIAVQDTGMGMDEATREHIFEPFFTTKGIGKGTGLGLAVVYGVVKGLHGFIDVQSTVGSGTTFSLYIPVPPQRLQTAATEENLIGEIPGGDETILLVEDEEALSFLLKTFLETKGYTVVVAKDGQEGVDSFMRQPHDIDLVLSDMGLPKMSGWDAAKKMREIRPELKIVLASGFIDPNQRSEILKNGVRDIFQKPYVPNDVLRRIREILDNG